MRFPHRKLSARFFDRTILRALLPVGAFVSQVKFQKLYALEPSGPHSRDTITAPKKLVKVETSIGDFFSANPEMENLTRICADLSNIVYYATDTTRPSKEILASKINEYKTSNPLLSQLELVDSWRDGAIFCHPKSKLLICVARGTEISWTTTCIRDLVNDHGLMNAKQAGSDSAGRLGNFIHRVQLARKKYAGFTVLTTGHSLGGAVAHDYALHYPDSFGIVFSPGGYRSHQYMRIFTGMFTWHKNENIVAFKPKGDLLTKFFDCPGIVINTMPTKTDPNPIVNCVTAHKLSNSPLVSEPSAFSDDPSPSMYENSQPENSTPKTEKPKSPTSGTPKTPAEKPWENTTQKRATLKPSQHAPSTPNLVPAEPATKPAKQSETTQKSNTPNSLPTKTAPAAAPRTVSPVTPEPPRTKDEIDRMKRDALKESKNQYHDKKRDYKDSMSGSDERKELIKAEQVERHARDEKIKKDADKQGTERAAYEALKTIEEQSKEPTPSDHRRSSSPSLFAVGLSVAAAIGSEKQNDHSAADRARADAGKTANDAALESGANVSFNPPELSDGMRYRK